MHGGKQWQTTPKNLPRMQCARAIPFTWLGSGSCQARPSRLNTNEWIMYIGPCIIVIVEELKTKLMSEFIKFYFTSSMLNMFRTFIHLSSGACDFYFIVSPHWLCVLVSMCVGVSVCQHGYHPNQPHRNSNTHRNKNTQPMWWYNKKVAGSWCRMYECPKHIEHRRSEIK